MRVVAGNTSHPPFARDVTSASRHLFDMPDGLELASDCLRNLKYGHEAAERQARAIIQRVAALAGKTERTLKMALLADRITQDGRQGGRVHNGPVGPGRRLAAADMQLARAVTASHPIA